MPPPHGILITTGRLTLAERAHPHLRELGHDLIEGGVDEAVELDLADRPVTAQGEADRGAHDARLGQRGVDHPSFAEVLLQAVGDPEDAAQLADVLAHDQDLGIVLHGLAQALVQCPGQGQGGHRPASSATKESR